MDTRLFFLLAILLAAPPARGQEPARHVEFPQATYEILLGQEFQTPVRIDPFPDSGLFSYGLIVTVEGDNGLVGIATMMPRPTLAFDGILGPGVRGVVASAGLFSGKGTADIFPPEKPNHHEPEIGTLAIAALPEGAYTLRLAPYNTLGPTETIFVDGQCRSLDGELAFGNAILTVTSRPQGTITAVGPLVPDRQTGLLLQEYELRNTGSSAALFRILIRNIPPETVVWNAHGTLDGVPYIDLAEPLAAGEAVRLTLEYRSQDRTTIPAPEFELAFVEPVAVPNPTGVTLALQPRATLAGGNVLLEFNSVAGESYYVQYTSDPASWSTALPKIEGTGNRIQWIDNGPPKTETHPSTAATRIYRIVVVQPTQP